MKKEQTEAITYLIQCTEYAQSKGVFSLLEAHNVFNSINVLMPVLEEE
ncbi:hypothetical protein [Tenacibaculum aiptasiae]|nr:hypothetical protein [Tenacibaculum aiptasiae]